MEEGGPQLSAQGCSPGGSQKLLLWATRLTEAPQLLLPRQGFPRRLMPSRRGAGKASVPSAAVPTLSTYSSTFKSHNW